MKKGFLIAYGELFLKSSEVQKIFRQKLISLLKFYFKQTGLKFNIYPTRERIFVECSNQTTLLKIIKHIFGISWFAKCWFFENAKLTEVSRFIEKHYPTWIKKEETFALKLKRGDHIEESREEIISKIAKHIKRKVNLNTPKKEIFIERRKEGWYLYLKKEKGQGGLPVSSGGKVLVLISGGIDSPTASYLMAKRGVKNVWIHFHSFPLVSKASIEKVKELARVFLKYQPKLKIYLVPFSSIQEKIKVLAPPRYRVLLYRRAMLRISEEIAKKENCLAIVTGESLGQVSSQTLENIKIIEEVTSLPILRPLIGMDKEEIIKLARKIKTFEISIRPQEDCCSLFISKHTSAKGNLKIIKEIEKNLNLKNLINTALKKAEFEEFYFGPEGI